MTISQPRNQTLKIMVVNDEEDILNLYTDFFSRRGHQILKSYLTAENVMDDVKRETPDVYLIDHKLPGTKDGLDLAAEILEKYPSAPIVFVTANENLESELSKHRIFEGKKLKMLLKPVKLHDIERHMLDLAGAWGTLSKFGSKNKFGSHLKSKPVIKSINVDKEKLNDLQHKLESPNVSNDAKYAVIKKTFGGVCSRCEGIPTKILSYDVKGAQLIEKYCDECFKRWVKQ